MYFDHSHESSLSLDARSANDVSIGKWGSIYMWGAALTAAAFASATEHVTRVARRKLFKCIGLLRGVMK